MPRSVLSTKLFPPYPISNLVERSELLALISQGAKSPFTIISAPPGFGKTTLIASWLKVDGKKKVAWFSLDEDDNEPGRFLAYIAASLQPPEPDSVPELDSLLKTSSPSE